jgi:hypothetical protein
MRTFIFMAALLVAALAIAISACGHDDGVKDRSGVAPTVEKPAPAATESSKPSPTPTEASISANISEPATKKIEKSFPPAAGRSKTVSFRQQRGTEPVTLPEEDPQSVRLAEELLLPTTAERVDWANREFIKRGLNVQDAQ